VNCKQAINQLAKENHMATLWDKLTKKKEPVSPTEFKVYNPLKLKIGDPMKMELFEDTTDLSRINFTVTGLREVVRTIDDQDFKFADYMLLGRTLDNQEIHYLVRLIPMENAEADITHSVILFNRLDGFGYNKDFHEGLAFERNGGEFKEGDKIYFRPNVAGTQEMIKTPWDAVTSFIKDLDHSGKIEEGEIKQGALTYWDFGNEFVDDSGHRYIEWYVVEMDGNGYFEIWVGKEIDPSRISVI
jgi:hypothetical protein